MHRIRVAAVAAFIALAAAGCQSLLVRGPASAPGADTGPDTARPALLLVSIDGFRADYLDRGVTPNIARLAADGARARWLSPSYPSLTFPNHYTVVTGLRPDQHGIVNNTMRDAALGRFSLGRQEAVGDGRWWGGEPVWVAAENAGLPTATLFWPGSEAAIGGVRPTRWLPYDGDMTMPARVDTVLGWLSEPAATRPRFATLYFDALDHAGHDAGPDSPGVAATLAEVDDAIGRLLDGLDARGLADAVDIVLVSDHGMAPVPAAQVIALEDMVDPADAQAVSGGPSAGFEPLPGRTAAAEAQLLGRHDHYRCWRKGELPAHWHYGSHPRVPAIVCQTDKGWSTAPRERIAQWPKTGIRGAHGFDPALPSMRAIFIARGPSIRDGVVVPAFDNVDVYPLLMRLLGLPPAANDGDGDALQVLEPGHL
ncbi:ectonucleotide pyrophosphatase/phosphodiesterase [Novilysobacter arseniciresistens]|uniref:alkaline phosphatase family protein n=1 Tax=Novilysobacter arseniciresistens TaxID=1385522 RepID=UPI00056136D2|nr:ectonucleotide pyrophosphatase/phosphodiesterase [Lysobacter arseniciresistens]